MGTVRTRRLEEKFYFESFSAVLRGHDKEILFKP